MTTKSRQYLYGASVRASAQRAKETRKEADYLACVAWNQRMLGFKGPAQPSPPRSAMLSTPVTATLKFAALAATRIRRSR
jgi:hypothetical protein